MQRFVQHYHASFRRLADSRIFKELFLRSLFVVIAASSSSVFAQESGFQQDLQAHYADILSVLQGRAISEELKTIAPLAPADAVERLAEFRPHKHDASRIDLDPQTEPPLQETATLSSRMKVILLQALSVPKAFREAATLKAAVTNLLPREKAWRALEALEQAFAYGAASRLARVMLETEPAGETRELLALEAARDGWLDKPGNPPADYAELLALAYASGNLDVANHARLWAEATTAPSSVEGLALCQQIWETCHSDLEYREKSRIFSDLVMRHGPRIVDGLRQSGGADAGTQLLAGRLTTYVALASFQQHNRDALSWATATAGQLDLAAIEDRLGARYYYAFYLYYRADYTEALAEFEEIFLSQAQCDVAADAGRMAATCFIQLNDPVGAQAVIDLLFQLFPAQTATLKKTASLREGLEGRQGFDRKLVKAFIDTRYGARLEQAQAGLRPRPGSTATASAGK